MILIQTNVSQFFIQVATGAIQGLHLFLNSSVCKSVSDFHVLFMFHSKSHLIAYSSVPCAGPHNNLGIINYIYSLNDRNQSIVL